MRLNLRKKATRNNCFKLLKIYLNTINKNYRFHLILLKLLCKTIFNVCFRLKLQKTP